jgi:hypothetical protein
VACGVSECDERLAQVHVAGDLIVVAGEISLSLSKAQRNVTARCFLDSRVTGAAPPSASR